MEYFFSNQLRSELGSFFTIELQIFLVAIFALMIGSFVSLISTRIATKEPIMIARSKCPKCHVTLKIRSLIPVLSYLFQGGKCLNCKAKISIRYILIELVFVLGFLVTFFSLQHLINARTLIYFAIFSTLMVMVIVDLENYFIPDSTQYFLAFLGILLIVVTRENFSLMALFKSSALYIGFGLALWLFFYVSAGGIEAIGVDDLKFFFIAGFMLGISNFLTFMLLTGAIGTLFGVIWQKVKKDSTFPFAPAICASCYLCLLFSKTINVSM